MQSFHVNVRRWGPHRVSIDAGLIHEPLTELINIYIARITHSVPDPKFKIGYFVSERRGDCAHMPKICTKLNSQPNPIAGISWMPKAQKTLA